MDYTDRFVANLLVSGAVTFLTMSAVEYFDWLDDGVAGLRPDVARVCLVALVVTVILFVLPGLWHILARPRRPRFFVDPPARAGAWRGRLTGVVFGLFAAISIISQLR
ncbi:hypothetical protein EVC45_09405 [Paraburkholderia sp. UYCP14C]|uniref:hypothetical protein n=1 Tax=Paraburkholderia sp. UYCP14C TaxID=2511130 RepID=UPI00101EF6DB|nr:hypothetical protein [Paraburkholderia sp. UYCP14C]RZF30211.1 hypothetical protein EVC45_09405 [Paraburkholderia sp. UYCP14C]